MNPVSDEIQYINLVKRVLETGETRLDRTGTGTLALFGQSMRFSLRNNCLPLLTTKKMPIRSIIAELLWFISGNTDAKVLNRQKVHIWDANGSREFLDSRGLHHRREGDLGPIYGFQWRHWGAEYINADTDYHDQGIDQIQRIIHTLRTNPMDRRMVLSAWNVGDIDQMALPPCHLLCQFFASTDRRLSCMLLQRSGDVGLGVPFNIASYSILTHMLAHITGMVAEELVYHLGDTHIYLNHREALRVQIDRKPFPFPSVSFNQTITNIDEFTIEDVHIKHYQCHDAISMKMSL